MIVSSNFTTELHVQNAANGISGVQISKIFRGSITPGPPLVGEDPQTCYGQIFG